MTKKIKVHRSLACRLRRNPNWALPRSGYEIVCGGKQVGRVYKTSRGWHLYKLYGAEED